MGLVTDVLDRLFADGLIRPYTEIVASRCKVVVLPLTGAVIGADIYFRPDSELSNGRAFIRAIEVCSSTEIVNTLNLPAYDVLPVADEAKAVLNFRKGDEVVSQIPLSTMDRTNNSGKFNFMEFDCTKDQDFRLHESSVSFSNLSGITPDTTAIYFVFWYDNI